MDIQNITARIMINGALNLINYLIINDITIINNNDTNILDIIVNNQYAIYEYINTDSSIQQLKNDLSVNTVYRQGLLFQLLDIARQAVYAKDKRFNHITKEYLNTLTIL
jgi:hypothetical protein